MFDVRPLIWVILALPALPLVWDFVVAERYFAELMYVSGMWSIQLLIVTLAITPLQRLTRIAPALRPVTRWLLSNRRYFGVAAFGYAALHVAFYIRYTELLFDVWVEALELRYLTGWIAVVIMGLMAAISNNWSVRRLGQRWKTLQRLIYPGLVFVFWHWILFAFFKSEALAYLAVLAVIKLAQVCMRWRANAVPETGA